MQIVMIPTEKIYSHPNNPRTDLGDITELVESIKVMGILQNLTLVPYDPATHIGVNVNGDGSDCYIAVAGNRRLAAAKKAKLSEVPAVISNMDFKAQNRVMLVENLQRETLSPYQQAKTIQLMMDLGDTVQDIAKQTGFSEGTVRNRLQLAKFSPEKMAKVEDRNATMKDYLDLAKIDDEALRNEVLESIGTANFRNDLARARSTLRDRKNKEEQEAALASFAAKISKDATDGLKFLKTYYASDKADAIQVPADKDTVQYFFVDNGYSKGLYREWTAMDTAEQEQKSREKDDLNTRKAMICEATERAQQLRMEFVGNLTFSKIKQNFGAVVDAIGIHILSFSRNGYTMIRLNHSLLHELTGVALNDKKEVIQEELQDEAVKNPEWTMFAMAYAMMETSTAQGYCTDQWWNVGAYAPVHCKNDTLDRIYKLLTALGYEMSDEEKQLQDGTHPMFVAQPAKKK